MQSSRDSDVPPVTPPPRPMARRRSQWRTILLALGALLVVAILFVALALFWVIHVAVQERPFRGVARSVPATEFGKSKDGAVATSKAVSSDEFFKGTNVPRLEIDVSKSGINALRRYQWGAWGWGVHGERPAVQATVREGTIVYTNVAIHLKGAAGSFRPVDDLPSLTLNFDKFAPGQKFHGLTKFSLNNSVQDQSYICEKISRELFAAGGVPTPRAAHAVVELNGRELGLYVLVEGYNKSFLKRHFKNASGNLYDGEFCKEITESLHVNSGDRPDDQAGRQLLAAAAMERDTTARWAKLEKLLDMDEFISFLVMESLTCHADGYSQNRNNYRLFHDLDRDKFAFMPHGMDQMFGTFRSSPQSNILPGMQGMVAAAVIRTPEGRRRFMERIAVLATNVLDGDRVITRVREIDAAIRPYFAMQGSHYLNSHDSQVRYLCQRIAERSQSVRDQLSAPLPATKFDNQGILALKQWRKYTANSAGFTLEEVASDDGRRALYLSSAGGGGKASWRTRTLLESGRYRLVARAITREANVGGICLRRSGDRAPRFLRPTEWTDVAYEFEIEEETREVDFVCELSGGGEAWFDLGSLKLIRL